MTKFITTAESFHLETGEKLNTTHWVIEARDQAQAEAISKGQVTNANRTITSVRNEWVRVEPFNLKICRYIGRNINCQGHRERKPLAQQRGGNEK